MVGTVLQLLSEVVFNPISSVLTGVLGNWLFTKTLLSEMEKGSIKTEFAKAFQNSISSQDITFYELVKDLTRYLGRDPEFARIVREEFTNCLNSLDRNREPWTEMLWSKYCRTANDKAGGTDGKKRLRLAILALWFVFRKTVEEFPSLRRLLLDQYEAAREEEWIGEYEACLLMKAFCRARLAECKQKMHLRYLLDAPPEGFTNEENFDQFSSYHPIPLMVWERWGDRDRRGPRVKDVFSISHNLVIYTGIGGVGKTRFFEELEKVELERLDAEDYPEYLPFLLTADEISREGRDTAVAVAGKIEHCLRNADLANYSAGSIRNKAKALAEYLRVRKGGLLLLVDGFDQVDAKSEQQIIDTLTQGSGYGQSRCAIATRPYRMENLCTKISNREIPLISIEPFSDKMIEKYFGACYPNVKGMVNHLKKRKLVIQQNRTPRAVHFLQIPLLARYLKEMTIYGRLEGIADQAGLMQRFVEHVQEQQAVRFNLSKDECCTVFHRLEELALHLLTEEHGMARIEFSRDQIYDHLNGTEAPVEEMRRFDLLRPIVDGGNRALFRFQHQLLQEFLAARCLWRKYRRDKIWQDKQKAEGFFRLLDAIKYDPDEVAKFLALLIATDRRISPLEEVTFWHEQVVMCQELQSDWVRTYGLQIRDAIADHNEQAAAVLARIFEGERITVNGDLQMVEIPAGAFVFGSYEDDGKRPVRLVVTNETVVIDRFLVTNLQFCVFLNANFSGQNCNNFISSIHYLRKILQTNREILQTKFEFSVKKGFECHPVTGVNLSAAEDYCEWRSLRESVADQPYRLPTEKEWERAARGRFGQRYPWGNVFFQERCNTKESGMQGTSPVGSYSNDGDSPCGCSDIIGNVWEWTNSDFASNYETVLRGGSWFYDCTVARCTYRFWDQPWCGDCDYGFRCARTIKRV